MSKSSNELALWYVLNEISWMVDLNKLDATLIEYGSIENTPSLLDLMKDNLTINNKKKFKTQLLKVKDIEKFLAITREEVHLVDYSDPTYPSLLKNISDPPLLLFYKGKLHQLNEYIAIVGTRKASFYAHTNARKIARILAKNGFWIVSGLARGIDTEAHCGALEAKNGKTIAVLPVLDPIYPPENEALAEDIIKRGAIVSEILRPSLDSKFLRLGTLQGKLVNRNRIISGLSVGVIVIESGIEGGTVHQVNYALEQKKPVLVLRPNKSNKVSEEGFKKFLSQGAIEIAGSKDALKILKKSPPCKKLPEYIEKQQLVF